jgi:hypothetical protein
MEKTCMNCTNVGGFNQDCIAKCAVSFYAKVNRDMSCPRFEAKKAEIPANLKNWTPVWHPASEKPVVDKHVLCYEKSAFGSMFFEVLKWTGEEWKLAWNGSVYDGPPNFWTELP